MGKKKAKGTTTTAAQAVRIGDGFRLADVDAAATPGWTGDRAQAEARTQELGREMSELQERLFAHGRTGGTQAVLLVLQGLDTSGKGGVVRHVIGMVDPQGVALASFGVPTAEELRHHYLWRIRRALPPPGRIGVFDRSHYEDVLVVRVDELVPRETWEQRYDEINRFERQTAERGIRIIKVALVVSEAEQYARLRERLERPDKHWKYNPSDLATRKRWPLYRDAYQDVFDRTSTDLAPWHVVPADRKWYARLAVSELLVEALRDLQLDWPVADYDVAAELAKLDATAPAGSASASGATTSSPKASKKAGKKSGKKKK
ncbi:protein of unknown function DUF344 [Beutenbergia cavernae DSM 12333]|uniref:Polyphosphate kinase-2-related domain-containing protein n=1 Tax=Beutenbergia cavernae (strain ATCC BAA-8 / DSM 12333 / CCUG 43141 / JCM 11478 / NBRC 16432 / NCIMB 13614 / HKI 0122) TaxID=471853 RepID=C5C0T8_BEUC1|nr:PPK2 family polyphosphate kinase [Beutenbergia cavernae]ACQ79342.1 protein of unknown function DUF344 [Beutenbergia cavernae DSM 12333]